MLRRFLSVAFVAGLIMLAAPVAHVLACSCAHMDREMALSNADIAFIGVVAAIDDPSIGPLVGSGDPLRYTFAIEQTLKGEAPASLDILSARSSASCGMEFGLAQRWRIFAYADESGHLQTGLCSGNELLAEGVSIPPPTPTPPPVAVVLAIGAVLVLAGVSAWAFTRRPGNAS